MEDDIPSYLSCAFFFFLKTLFMREQGKERNINQLSLPMERNINQLSLPQPPSGGLAHNPGMCPDWEPNWQPFRL